MDEKSRSALSLFGGPRKVNDRITNIIREKLKGKNLCKKEELEKYLNLPPGLLNRIKQRQEGANIGLFEKLEGPLYLPSIYDILGAPDFNTNGSSRREWEEERKRSPMYVVARGGGQPHRKVPKKLIKLESYVSLRAIGELYRTHSSEGQ